MGIFRAGHGGCEDVTEKYTLRFGRKNLPLPPPFRRGYPYIPFEHFRESERIIVAHLLTFQKVSAPEDGVYEMRLYYACGVDRRVVYSINGEDEIRSGKLNAGVNTLAMERFYVRLKKGENTISFGNTTAKAPNIVSLGISKTAIKEDDPDATQKPSETDDPNATQKPAETDKPDATQKPPEAADLDNNFAPKAVKINVKAKGYELSKITLKKGKKVKLVTAVLPAEADQKLVFTSDKASVATVNEQGVVKAKKAGKVKITAATADGSSLKKTISIWVVKKNKKNTKLALKKNKTSLKKGQTTQISVKKLTKKTTDKITYKVSAGKKYIRVDAYGTVSVKKYKKKVKAVVTVRCGRKSRKFKVALKA